MTDAPPDVSPQRPWLGLRSYTLATQAYFYGRDDQIRELYQRVELNPLTVLYGRSGLGKTSLLQAGLLPRLTVEGRNAVLVRLDITAGAPPLLAQVHAAFTAQTGIAADAKTLWELAHHRDSRNAIELARPVLVFDQFEEIFTLDRRQTQNGRRGELAAFMAELANLVENRPPDEISRRCDDDRAYASGIDLRESALRVVVALREDYLHELERWKKLLPSLMRNRMELLELDGPSAQRAVVGPGSKHKPALADAEVAAEIVRFVAGRPAGTELAEIDAVPPLLSLLCAELNQARLDDQDSTISSERVSQQSGDILQRFYERCFDGLPDSVRDVVEDLLVDNSGRYRESSSRETVVGEIADRGVADAAAIVDRLIERRLLSSDRRDGAQRIELTHDLLVPLAAASRAAAERRREQAVALQRAEEQRRDRMNRLKGHAAIVLALLLVVAAIAAGIAYREGRLASAAHVQAQSARKKVEETLSQASRRALGRFAERIDAADGSRYAYLAESLSYRGLDDAKAAALLALQQARSAIEVMRFDVGSSEVTEASFSDDGSLLLTNTEPDRAALWDARTGQLRKLFDARARGAPVRLSRDGSRIAWIDVAGFVRFLDTAALAGSGTTVPYAKPAIAIEFGADRHTLLTVAADEVRLWNLATTPASSSIVSRAGRISSAQFDADAERIVVVNAGGDISVHASIGGAVVLGPLATRRKVESASLSPGGSYLVATSGRREISVWNTRTRTPIWSAETQSPLRSVGFSPDGTLLALEYLDGRFDRRFAESTQPLDSAPPEQPFNASRQLGPAGSYARHPAFSPDGVLFAGIVDATPSLRMTRDSHRLAVLAPRVDAIAFRFLPAGTQLLAIGASGRLSIEEIRSRSPLCDMDAEALAPHATAEPVSGEPAFRHLHLGDISAAAFSRDGKRAAVILESGEIVAIRTIDGSVTFRTRLPEQPMDLHYSPAGDVIALTSPRRMSLLDSSTGALVVGNLEHGGPIHALAFSADGKRLALGHYDGVQLWSARTGVVLTEKFLRGHPTQSLHFSDDDRRLIAVLDDGRVASCTVRVDIAATPERLAEAMEQLGRKKVADDGRLQTAEGKDLFAGFSRRGPQSHLEQLLRWRYDANPPATIAPFSTTRLDDYLEREIDHTLRTAPADGQHRLARLYLHDPANPRILEAMSHFEPRADTKALWERLLTLRKFGTNARPTAPAAPVPPPAARPAAKAR